MIATWDQFHDAYFINKFLKDLRWNILEECVTYPEQKYVRYNLRSSRGHANNTGTYTLIPDKMFLDCETIHFKLTKDVSIRDYQNVLNFIGYHIPYMRDWIIQENIDVVPIKYDASVTKDTEVGIMSDYINFHSYLSELLESDNENKIFERSILAFIVLTKKFYNPSKEFVLKAKNVILFDRIKNHSDAIRDNMAQPDNYLNQYSILSNDVNNKIVSNDMKNRGLKKFEFFSNTILKTPYFDMYTQNLDLKLLTYIHNLSRFGGERK